MNPVKTKPNLTKEEWHSIQQPIDKKTGRVNPLFDNLYGAKTKNPFWGTDRDPDSKRVETLKIKEEYDNHKHEMTPREQFKYESFLKGKFKKIT